MFIETGRELTIGSRTYPPGAVVAVDKHQRKRLVEGGAAADHPGPAFDPSAPADAEAVAGDAEPEAPATAPAARKPRGRRPAAE